MKRYGGLWARVVAFDNLYLAWCKARRGKCSREEVARFGVNLERELFALRQQLLDGSYEPGRYRLFTIYERKPRQIAAAPFRDRVVHHAVMNVIEPLLDPRFIHDCYACRRGKGVHRAVDRYQGWSRRYCYALKLDVASYFPSIDHRLLNGVLERHLKDPHLLALLALIIEARPEPLVPACRFEGDDLLTPLERPRGIPIGNLTSQFFANLYLGGFDHWVKQSLGASAYLRYVDDMLLLSDSKQQLWEWAAEIEAALARLRLRLHPLKRSLFQTRCGVDVLGYRVFPGYRLLRNDNGHRFARKLHRFADDYRPGSRDWEDFNPSVQSWIGHASQADTLGLRQRIFGATVFVRGTDHTVAGARCVAVPGTTTPGGCAPPTATTTTGTTATTGSVSAWPVRPHSRI